VKTLGFQILSYMNKGKERARREHRRGRKRVNETDKIKR
jgi:hypothetical protein